MMPRIDKIVLDIAKGGVYQQKHCLLDLVNEDMANALMQLAGTKGWREVQTDEAKENGFVELAEWAMPETDVLILIDDRYLVCLNRSMKNN